MNCQSTSSQPKTSGLFNMTLFDKSTEAKPAQSHPTNLPRPKTALTFSQLLRASSSSCGINSAMDSHGGPGRSSLNSVNNGSASASGSHFMGDRFIPYRGNQDNFFLEEFILNHDDPFKCDKNRKKKTPAARGLPGSARPANEGQNGVGTNDIIVEDVETESPA